jgi:hypothetical protein
VTGENVTMRSFTICITHNYCAGDKIEKNEMDGECSLDGGGDWCVQGYGVET